jgi:hypothetical protein
VGAEYVDECKRYIDPLICNDARIKEEEYNLIWSLNPTGNYVPRSGYKALVGGGREDL